MLKSAARLISYLVEVEYKIRAAAWGADKHIIYPPRVISGHIVLWIQNQRREENISMKNLNYMCHCMVSTLYVPYILQAVLSWSRCYKRNYIFLIGKLSEESDEFWNEHIRLFILNYTRKFSRVACNIDVLNRHLLTSDPQ